MREIVSLSLPKKLNLVLKQFAKKEHTNASEIIRQALNEFIARKKFQALCDRSILECKQKGIKITEEDLLDE